MSDLNLKKVVVSTADLPGFGAIDGGYTIRYRIITEDKNQFSDWSPLYFLPIEDNLLNTGEANASIFTNSPSYITSFGENKILNIYWNDLSSFGIREYDIFLKFDSDDYKHHTTTGNNSANVGIGDFTGTVDIRVLVKTPQKIYEEDLVLFKTSGPITVA
jgi:hypothetical protein